MFYLFFAGSNLCQMSHYKAQLFHLICCCFFTLFVDMTGGNQRELARQKNAKKHTEQTKGKRNEDGLSAAARKQR